MSEKDSKIKMLGETENYAIWMSEEEDVDEPVFHIEIGNLTIHLFESEWEEFAEAMMQAMR